MIRVIRGRSGSTSSFRVFRVFRGSPRLRSAVFAPVVHLNFVVTRIGSVQLIRVIRGRLWIEVFLSCLSCISWLSPLEVGGDRLEADGKRFLPLRTISCRVLAVYRA